MGLGQMSGNTVKLAPKGSAQSRLYVIFVAAFLLASASIFYLEPPSLQSLRMIVFDSYQRLWPAPQLRDSPVRIVAIDEQSLERHGQWPWPRTVMARLTDALGEAGAKAIVFDVMFSEPDRTSPEQMLTWLPPEQAEDIRSNVASWPTHDDVFARSIDRFPVVLAATLHGTSRGEEFDGKAGIGFAGDNPIVFLAPFSGFSDNLSVLSNAARGIGAINWEPDGDQIVRRIPLIFRYNETIVPSLALEALRVADEESTYFIRSSNAHGAAAFGQTAGVNQLRVGDHMIPTDARGGVWIHYRHADPDSYVSASDILSGNFNPALVRGKIVLIGATAPGLMDLRATPLDVAAPGVEVHRQVLEQILSERYLTRPDIAGAIELLAAIAAVVLLALGVPRMSAGGGAVLGVATLIALFSMSAVAFLKWGLLLDAVFPAICSFLFASASTVYLYRRTEMQRAEIRRAFSRYVSPSVVKQLVAKPEQLTLGGELRDLTLMFCDVRDFTTISEHLGAEELTAFINSLLTPLTDVIIERKGTVDKYMGDAIMSFWNAPLDDADHARHACEAVVLMMAAVDKFNSQRRIVAEKAGQVFDPVRIGIGVNSGECCVGNLGSLRRFDYSAIGDNVNITSRLEGLTKRYRLPVIIGEDTVRRLPDLPFLEVDLVRVKGREAPIRIFTLLSVLGLPESNWERTRSRHAEFFAAQRGGDLIRARALLGELVGADAQGLAGVYAQFARSLEALAAQEPSAEVTSETSE
jgi:adenylate cyclase